MVMLIFYLYKYKYLNINKEVYNKHIKGSGFYNLMQYDGCFFLPFIIIIIYLFYRKKKKISLTY